MPHAAPDPHRLRQRFPGDFAWGTATASYQIEGAVAEDGRARSIWDDYCRRPGAILGGDTGDITCDHYHRYREDAALLGWLGAGYYRFSLAWPRLIPDGRGPLNRRGVDFYHRLLDELDRHGIQPWVTIYHWDLPSVLQERHGGWAGRATVDAYADFAVAVHAEFGDRIRHWTTLNEPFCSAFYGYASGTQAPGITDERQAVAAGHHLLLGHGRAVAAMRAERPDNHFGITLNLSPTVPAGDDPADHDGARRIDARKNRFFLDPLFRGGYPADLRAEVGQLFDGLIQDGDLAAIGQPLDFLGVNYYRRFVVRGAATPAPGEPPTPYVGCSDLTFADSGRPRTQMGWEIDPEGLRDLLVRLSADYPVPPLYVTENGMARADTPDPDGRVDDPERVDYLHSHLTACADARDRGVDLRGYFVWSALDNFEWSLGLERRFGLIHVDYPTQRRTPKTSAHWYRTLVRTADPQERS